jgi:hypothetical protein
MLQGEISSALVKGERSRINYARTMTAIHHRGTASVSLMKY